jgi:UDP-glucuronate decarboxylase
MSIMGGKRILVTGGAGFLGSHLCERLLSEGNAIICIDDLSTGNLNNIKHLLDNENFKFYKSNVQFSILHTADEIYNLACPASPVHYQSNPIRTMKTNILGSLNVLGIAKQIRAKVLQASTSEVYGDPKEHPQTEGYWGNVNPNGIRSCYDEGKRAAECLFFDYHRQYGIDTKIARIFNTYGPKMDIEDGRVVSNFIVQALSGKDITIFGDGSQTRSFCYVNDTIDGLIKLMESPINRPVNIGNPAEITVLELAYIIIKLTNSKSRIVNHILPEDDPVRRKPDISYAREYLKWEPKVEIIEGINKTIEYFRGVLNK